MHGKGGTELEGGSHGTDFKRTGEPTKVETRALEEGLTGVFSTRVWIRSYPSEPSRGRERGRTNPLQTSNVFAPSSHTSLCTFPTLRQNGQLTTSYSSLPSFVGRSFSPHPAHRSALTRQAEWKICPQTVSSPPPFKIPIRFMDGELRSLNTSGKGSSSEGPIPQLGSSHLKPT